MGSFKWFENNVIGTDDITAKDGMKGGAFTDRVNGQLFGIYTRI